MDFSFLGIVIFCIFAALRKYSYMPKMPSSPVSVGFYPLQNLHGLENIFSSARRKFFLATQLLLRGVAAIAVLKYIDIFITNLKKNDRHEKN